MLCQIKSHSNNRKRNLVAEGHEVGRTCDWPRNKGSYDNNSSAWQLKTGFHEDYVKDNEEKAPDFAASALFSGIELYQPSPFDKIQAEEYKIIREIAAGIAVLLSDVERITLRDQSHVSIFCLLP